MYKSLLQPDLRLMLREGDAEGLRAFLKTLFPGLVAEIMEEMEPEEVWEILAHCDPPLQAEIFQFFSIPEEMRLVENVDRGTLSKIIEEMAADDRVDLLSQMDQEHVDALLPLIAQAERNDIKKLLAYPEESVGSIMTTEYASLPADITAGEAINRLRLQAPSRETIYYIYITDDQRRLLGFLSLRRLITSKPTVKLADIMERDLIKLRVDADQESAAQEIVRLAFIAMPVVDDQDRLVGIVTYDDAAEVLQEEATEDAHRLAAVEPLDFGYLETPLLTLVWKRGVWLVILLGAAFLTATVLSLFQDVEDEVGAVASGWMVLFLPMVLASGGNAGSQSATLIIRMLALKESRSTMTELYRIVLWRELRLGAMLGLTVGAAAWVVTQILVSPSQAGVVGTTIVLVITFGAVTGSMLPLILRTLRLDPALMSNPLISALSDAMGVIIFYQTAHLLLGI